MKKMPLMLCCFISTAAFIFAGCDGESDADSEGIGSSEAQQTGQNGEDTGRDDLGRQSAGAGCTAIEVSGTFRAGETLISAEGATIILSARHKDTCIGEVDLSLTTAEGCLLEVSATSVSSGEWTVQDATFSACPSALVDGTFSGDESTFGLLAAPDLAPDQSCFSAEGLSLVGRLVFTTDEEQLPISLDGLVFSGDLSSTVSDEVICAPLVASCEAVTCGEDAYGVVCGSCDEGTKCIDGTCETWNCPPEGPYGTEIGDTVLNIKLQDCDGNTHSLQDLCGAPAGFFNLLAGY